MGTRVIARTSGQKYGRPELQWVSKMGTILWDQVLNLGVVTTLGG